MANYAEAEAEDDCNIEGRKKVENIPGDDHKLAASAIRRLGPQLIKHPNLEPPDRNILHFTYPSLIHSEHSVY